MDADAASTGRGAQIALWAAAVGFTMLLVWQAVVLPDRVPGHVGGAGEVTRWDSKGAHLAVGAISGLVLMACFWLLPRVLASGRGVGLVNIPHKQYWTRPENWPVASRMLREEMAWLGAVMLVFVGYALWMNGEIARGRPAPIAGFWILFTLVMVGAVGYGIWSHRSARWRPRE